MIEKTKVLSIRVPENLANLIKEKAKRGRASEEVKRLIYLHYAPEYFKLSIEEGLLKIGSEEGFGTFLDLHFLEGYLLHGIGSTKMSLLYLQEKLKMLQELESKVKEEVRSSNELTSP